MSGRFKVGFVLLVDKNQIHTANSPANINTLATALDIWGIESPISNGLCKNVTALSEALRLQTALDVKYGEGVHLVEVAPVKLIHVQTGEPIYT